MQFVINVTLIDKTKPIDCTAYGNDVIVQLTDYGISITVSIDHVMTVKRILNADDNVLSYIIGTQ